MTTAVDQDMKERCERANSLGRVAHESGKTLHSNPYPDGSDEAKAWRRGWEASDDVLT